MLGHLAVVGLIDGNRHWQLSPIEATDRHVVGGTEEAEVGVAPVRLVLGVVSALPNRARRHWLRSVGAQFRAVSSTILTRFVVGACVNTTTSLDGRPSADCVAATGEARR